jgi:hypothetical protein
MVAHLARGSHRSRCRNPVGSPGWTRCRGGCRG